MNENLKVRLSNPVVVFFGTVAMFLLGVVIGTHWHPSLAHSLEIAVIASIFAALHELASCFVWCSLSAWWIGRRTGAFDRKA